jgi:guanosine-3',5'-bis(diphosphate) 3'-pyrophosphohydrolase
MMRESNAVLWDAIAFAARAHRYQIRKDGQTPYVSHVFRVAMILRHVFGIDDERILAAAVLHDTIEDTLTDRDELIEHFGPEVADWVAVLTKDKRLPEPERETAYIAAVCAADWPVHVIKLADLYDNIQDSKHFPSAKREQSLAKWKACLEALGRCVSQKTADAHQFVAEQIAKCRAG